MRHLTLTLTRSLSGLAPELPEPSEFRLLPNGVRGPRMQGLGG
jgi:hypothetical protein